MKNNIPINISGIYLITCLKNNKKYVGASVNARNRASQHFNKQCMENYKHLELQKDVLKFGKNSFKVELLEEVSQDDLLKYEQKWFDKIKPEYNLVRPCENMLIHPLVRERALNSPKNKQAITKRRKLYNTPGYQKFFKTFRKDMKPVDIIKDNEVIKTCVSIRSTGRWLDENTNFKSKNKASKVKAVCDGERKTAFGYKFKYSDKSVETILGGSRYSIDTNIEAVSS